MVRCTQVLVNAGHGSAVQIPVLQLLGVDLCVNPDFACAWRNILVMFWFELSLCTIRGVCFGVCFLLLLLQ